MGCLDADRPGVWPNGTSEPPNWRLATLALFGEARLFALGEKRLSNTRKHKET
jgi:hypothetical protein